METTFVIGSCRIQKPFQLLLKKYEISLNCKNIGINNFCHYSNEIIQYINLFSEIKQHNNELAVVPQLPCIHFVNAKKFIIEISSIKNVLNISTNDTIKYLNIVKVQKKLGKPSKIILDNLHQLVDNLLTISYLLNNVPILFISHINPENSNSNRKLIIDAMKIVEQKKDNITFLNPTKFLDKFTFEEATISGKPTEYSKLMLNELSNEIDLWIKSC